MDEKPAGKRGIRSIASSFGKYVLPGLLTAAILAGVGLVYREVTKDDTHGGGWWPTRPVTYRCDKGNDCLGANHVVFNSTVNLPSYGDEREFADARTTDMSRNRNVDHLHVSIGDVVVLRAYIDNDANPARVPSGDGTAVGTMVRFALPNESADDQLIWAFISADNADPPIVGDTILRDADDPFTLTYLEGSAQLFNSVFGNGFELGSSVISDGVEIGVKETAGRFCCQLDGRYPACDPTQTGCEVFGSLVEITVRVMGASAPSGIARL